MRQLFIASANSHKITEIKAILQGIPYEMKDYIDMGMTDDVAETGSSYEENARMKAETGGKKFNILALADDSGLEVDILEGKPGIHSARYHPGSSRDKINKLLSELSGVPEKKRTARYRSIVALYDPETDGTMYFAGVCKGRIRTKPLGDHGFGYDPVFYSDDLGKTFGEATDMEKQRVSHRARALLKCKEHLVLLRGQY